MSEAELLVPPHSIPAEQAVLGSLMLDPDAWDRVADILVADDFYRGDHRKIFLAINELVDKQQPYDVITVTDVLHRTQPDFPSTYLLDLVSGTASSANIRGYATIVRERSAARRLIDACTQSVSEAYATSATSSDDLISRAEQRIFSIAEAGARTTPYVDMKSTVRSFYAALTERYNSRGTPTGITTGFNELDRMTSGFDPSDLIIVAARPSMGKTAFALNIAEHAAVKQKKTVLVFSMEMSRLQLAFRFASSIGRLNIQRLQNGELEEEEWPRVAHAVSVMNDASIIIDESAALSTTEVRARSRRVAREHGLGLIVIDYIQLMRGSTAAGKENRTTEISDISRSLKALAKELNVPVVALSQLNRSVEQRADKRPVMSDLRESGAIEQDADVIMFIYRDDYYNKDSADAGMAEIIISKQRMGPTGAAKLAFQGQFSRFENVTYPDPFGP
jgi:replicative DNA helicase